MRASHPEEHWEPDQARGEAAPVGQGVRDFFAAGLGAVDGLVQDIITIAEIETHMSRLPRTWPSGATSDRSSITIQLELAI